MPQNKFQECIYALICVLITVPCFVLYCMSIESGGILNIDLSTAIIYLLMELPLAWFSAHFLGSPLAMKFAFRHFPPAETHPKILQTALVCYTATIMCTWMSFLATIIYQLIFPAMHGADLGGLLANFLPLYLQTLVTNFPFALLGQLFFIQPATRKIFSIIFAKKLATGEVDEEVATELADRGAIS